MLRSFQWFDRKDRACIGGCFVTRRIENGVDISTVSRWLGHQDGSALCMKTLVYS
jgi:hypothetical protein